MFIRRLSAILLASLTVVASFAQTNQIDPTFDPVVSSDVQSANQLIQSDGKIVVWSSSITADGVAKGNIARLNADGSLDTGFDDCGCHLTKITRVVSQLDGKLLVSGVDNTRQTRIIRLNIDGSLDASFSYTNSPAPNTSSEVTVWLVQPDGRVLADLHLDTTGSASRFLIRLNADGSGGSGFLSSQIHANSFISSEVADVVQDSDGDIYVGYSGNTGGSTVGAVAKFNPNGGIDGSWEPPAFGGGNRWVEALAIQPDGALVIVGRFSEVNAVSRPNIVRLLPPGNVDLTFAAFSFISIKDVAALPDGKTLINASRGGSGIPHKIFRLNLTGSIDSGYVPATTVVNILDNFAVDGSERTVFFARTGSQVWDPVRFFRLNVNGDEDTGFTPDMGHYGRVMGVAAQADGKLIIAGSISSIDGMASRSIARLNTDGTHDGTFDPGTGFGLLPRQLIVQPDGKIIATGDFFGFNGNGQVAIARLNADGSFDSGFRPTVTPVRSAGLQADGKIVVGGDFSTVNGQTRNLLARLNGDGTLDAAFNVTINGTQIRAVVIQPDGKILIGGTFSGVGGFNRTNMARLNTDGSVDQSFNAGSNGIDRMWLQTDGKILVAVGASLKRINSDGTPDNGFTGPAFTIVQASTAPEISSIGFAADGSLIVGGTFNRVGGVPRSNIARLRPDGGLNLQFFLNGTNGTIHSVFRQADGRFILGGAFSRIETLERIGIARISVPEVIRGTPFDFNGDGRSDVAVYRSSTNAWYTLYSGGGPIGIDSFGASGDITAAADYDGDGKTDLGIFRPSTGTWWYKSSISGAINAFAWGVAGDIPRPSDFDGDGKADFIVYHPPNNTWYRAGSLVGPLNVVFGTAGDQPLVGDFDGDGRSDPAVFRPSTGDWWYSASSQGGAFRTGHWGQNGDVPVPADYDGDGKTDLAVFRPVEGGWYILNSSNLSVRTLAFGLSGDRPVAADYDGDGKADVAVFRPADGIWYILQSTSGFGGVQWGISTDTPVQGSFLP